MKNPLKKQPPLPSFASTVESPMVQIGTIIGCPMYMVLTGRDAAEREHQFRLARELLTSMIPKQEMPEVDRNV